VNLTHSPFPPIADHGFLSDCHTGALVAPDGSVDGVTDDGLSGKEGTFLMFVLAGVGARGDR
jgi:hypothetical protein